MNKVRSIWESGGKAVGGWLQMTGVLHAEAMARLGYDALVIDMQHSGTEFDSAVAMMIAIENGGAEPFVRVRWNNPDEIGKLADLGAYGIIAPMIESADDARRLASAVHYPPRGARSFGPRRPLMRYGNDYFGRASDTIVSMAMIETERGLANLDDVLSVEGIDGIFIGPADLAVALGRAPKPDSDDPVVVDAVRMIRERVHAAGKRVGVFCGAGPFARAKLAEGFDFVTLTPDLAMLTASARRVLEEARGGET
ncbi:MAG: HpcH/HpaI aldolase [Salinarimonadaceae bacterium]|nr:MAG: HpcH/HpaI aldolase [Salinarimonadaceae bacterium]